MVHLRDAVVLRQILVVVIDVLDHAQERLQDRLPILEPGLELELVRVAPATRRDVLAGCDVNLVEHVVVEVELVRADPWLFEGIDAQRCDEHFLAILVLNERVHVRRIGGVVQDDERCVHVTRREGRGGPGHKNGGRCDDRQRLTHGLHVEISYRLSERESGVTAGDPLPDEIELGDLRGEERRRE